MKFRFLALLVLLVFVLTACLEGDVDCEQLDNSGFFKDKDACYTAEAIEQQDESICDVYLDENSPCRARVALAVNDKSLCDDASDKGWCLRIWDTQKMGSDIRACAEKEEKDECLAFVAAQAGSTSPCFSADNRDYCIGVMAGSLNEQHLCDSARDQDVCLAAMGVEAVELEDKGECKYDDECPNTCDAHIVQKWACNGRTNACEPTFRDDCTKEFDVIVGYSIPKTCGEGTCTLNRDHVFKQKEEISDVVKDLLAARQDMTELQLHATDECLKGLSDITVELIVDSAELVASLFGGIKVVEKTLEFGVAKSAGLNLVSQPFAQALSSAGVSTPPTEYITNNCKLQESLEEDLDNLDKQIKKLQKDTEELNTALLIDSLQ